MTPAQFRSALAKLGLSQLAAGHFLGVEGRQVRRWLAEEHPIPESVAKLLRLMERLKLRPEDVG